MSSNEPSDHLKNKLTQATIVKYKKIYDSMITDKTFDEFLKCQLEIWSSPYKSLLDSNDYELIYEEEYDGTKEYPDIKPDEIIVTSINAKNPKNYVFILRKKKLATNDY